jgi:LysM repeat protein
LYDRAAMVARNRARYLAPIALVATIAATYLVVHAALNVGASTTTTTATTSRSHRARHTNTAPKVTTASVYIVKSGDTLGGISVKTHIPVPKLESLNSGVNPNALQTGQRLRLR